MLNWISDLIEFFNNASTFFYNLYVEAYNSIYIPLAFANILYSLSSLMSSIAWAFYDGYIWASDVWDRIQDILTWDSIYSLILSYFPNLNNVLSWFSNWINYVWGQIDSWWQSTKETVEVWIDNAVDLAFAAWDWLVDGFNTLQTAWDNFKTKIPTIDEILAWFGDWWATILSRLRDWGLLSGLEISDLIDSVIRTWFPFYDTLFELWNDIRDFFTDPEAWIYEKLDNFFERFW